MTVARPAGAPHSAAGNAACVDGSASAGGDLFRECAQRLFVIACANVSQQDSIKRAIAAIRNRDVGALETAYRNLRAQAQNIVSLSSLPQADEGIWQ